MFLLVKMLLEASNAAKNGRGRRSGHGKGLNPKPFWYWAFVFLLEAANRAPGEHKQSTSRA